MTSHELEAALRESEDAHQRYEMIFAHAPIGIEIYDKQGAFIEANRKCLDIFGVTDCAAVKGFNLLEDPNVSPANRDALKRGEAIRYDTAFDFDIVKSMNLYPTSRSATIELNVTIEPLRRPSDNTLSGYIVVVQDNTDKVNADVTERRHAEESLKKSEEKFSKAFQACPGAISIASMEDGRYIDVNDVFLAITGYAREEVIGRTSAEMNVWADPEDRKQYVLTLLKNGSLKNFITRFRMRSGEIRDFDVASEIIELDGERCSLNFIFDITERERAEGALRESEERYHNLLDDAPVGIAVQSEGKIVFTNPTGLKILGADSYDQVIGKPITDIIHPDELPSSMDRIRRLVAGEKGLYPAEDVYVRMDGTPINVEVVSTMLTYNGKPAAQVIVTDISGRKKTEEALQYERTLLRTLIDNIPDAIYTKDLHFRKTLANAAELHNLGMDSEAEVLGKDDFDLYPRDLAEGFAADDQLVLDTGTPVINREEYILDDDGHLRWLLTSKLPLRNSDDEIIGIVGIGRDITDRKYSEQLLSEEKERLSITLRSIGDGVVTTDTNSTVVMLNKAAEEMTGWKTEDAAGRHITEVFVIINDLTREPCENPVENVLSTGNIIELANHTCLIAKDGRELVIADSAAPIRDTQSRIIGVVLVFRDMTEKQKLHDSIQRAQKLESLGILAGGIAHDFNNMLAGIFGYLDIAKESAAMHKTDQIPKYLDKALGVFDRAKGLTQQLLTFSKGGTPIRKTLQLGPIIRHSASFALSGSNVICQLDLADDLWLCDCDETQIGQAIDNIVINAKQAMPMGGKIVITASNAPEHPAHSGTFVAISIKDEGIGMPKEILPKIFDPFFSTKQTGHGLGLATVFSIIQRHDGWIDVESKPGKGTTFHIFIPATQTAVVAGSGRAPVDHKGTGTILVMDDEDFIREIVESMLQNMGYDVRLAKDGQEALALFTEAEQSGTQFIASILDMTIPGGIGGKEVAASMRAISPGCVIIASSGYSEDPVIAAPRDYGFTDRIIKPYRKDEMMDVMIRIMQRTENGE